ncbi:uncharacterized protein VTP21DRAFT_1208 [Calcarisporiella thermophila]|uniref:uncharacterized protein n=1 Tax=Calcarisporiella thermophila TaxID=911321 RepID=UPI0037423F29
MRKLGEDTVRRLNSAQVITSIDSVVKELVENSIDAGATSIEVKLVGDGLTSIAVKDNGTGIALEDYAHVGQRYYTSKIERFEDLERVMSYGFRGEALNSVCSVSLSVNVTTRTAKEAVATLCELDRNGNLINSKTVGPSSSPGTTVVANKIFINFPVRRKLAQKSASISNRRIQETLITYSLIHPDIRFSLKHVADGAGSKKRGANATLDQNWIKPASNTTQEVIKFLFGGALASRLQYIEHELQYEDDTLDQASQESLSVIINAWLPERDRDYIKFCKGERVYLYINGRPVAATRGEMKTVVTTVRETFFKMNDAAMEGSKKTPFMMLNFKLSPSQYDVNIEPSKNAVLFHRPQTIFDALEQLLEKAWGKPQSPPPCDTHVKPAVAMTKENTEDTHQPPGPNEPALIVPNNTLSDEDNSIQPSHQSSVVPTHAPLLELSPDLETAHVYSRGRPEADSVNKDFAKNAAPRKLDESTAELEPINPFEVHLDQWSRGKVPGLAPSTQIARNGELRLVYDSENALHPSAKGRSISSQEITSSRRKSSRLFPENSAARERRDLNVEEDIDEHIGDAEQPSFKRPRVSSPEKLLNQEEDAGRARSKNVEVEDDEEPVGKAPSVEQEMEEEPPRLSKTNIASIEKKANDDSPPLPSAFDRLRNSSQNQAKSSSHQTPRKPSSTSPQDQSILDLFKRSAFAPGKEPATRRSGAEAHREIALKSTLNESGTLTIPHVDRLPHRFVHIRQSWVQKKWRKGLHEYMMSDRSRGKEREGAGMWSVVGSVGNGLWTTAFVVEGRVRRILAVDEERAVEMARFKEMLASYELAANQSLHEPITIEFSADEEEDFVTLLRQNLAFQPNAKGEDEVSWGWNVVTDRRLCWNGFGTQWIEDQESNGIVVQITAITSKIPRYDESDFRDLLSKLVALMPGSTPSTLPTPSSATGTPVTQTQPDTHIPCDLTETRPDRVLAFLQREVRQLVLAEKSDPPSESFSQSALLSVLSTGYGDEDHAPGLDGRVMIENLWKGV